MGIGAAPLLAACGDGSSEQVAGGKAPYALARPDQPVKLAIKDSNPPIADGLSPESGGDFKILNYSDYMAPGVMKDFGKKHGVSVQVTPYNNYDEMLAKIRAPGESFDLVFPGPSVLSKMVYTELLQPLNHTLRPQPRQRLAGVPGPVVRPRGSLHRALHDLRHRRALPHRPGERVPENGYDLMWDKQYAGKVYILDDLGEAIGMSLLRNDITTDINTSNADYVSARRPTR